MKKESSSVQPKGIFHGIFISVWVVSLYVAMVTAVFLWFCRWVTPIVAASMCLVNNLIIKKTPNALKTKHFLWALVYLTYNNRSFYKKTTSIRIEYKTTFQKYDLGIECSINVYSSFAFIVIFLHASFWNKRTR